MNRVTLALTVLTAVVGLPACDHGEPPELELIAVKAAVVERASTASSAHYSAQIVPTTRVDLAFKGGGYIDMLATVTDVDGKPRPLQSGDPVQAGMKLASVRKAEYQQSLAESQAAYAQQIAGADQANLDYQRSAKLADQNVVPLAELDAARSRRRGAFAGSSGAKARRDRAAAALADAILKSPIDGIVLDRSIEVGALAAPGAVAFSIADIRTVKAAFGVPDTVLPKLHIGDLEMVTTDAYPGQKFQGKISSIAVSADPRTRMFEVDVTIPNEDGRLRPGAVASLALEAAAADKPLPQIPLAAITRSPTHPDRFAVYVIEAAGDHSVVHAREVELGEYLGRVIPVKKGLAGGEKIVVQGAGLVSDGEIVEVVP